MTTVANKRQDTKLEAEGAEFLVLGDFLIQGVLSTQSTEQPKLINKETPCLPFL